MAEYHFPIPGSFNEKEIIIFVRRHWVSFLGQFLLSFLLLILPITILIILIVLGYLRTFQGIIANIAVLTLSAYYLVVLTFAFVSWISFYYDVYIVTRTEIIEITQVGFFGRKISQLSLLRVQDVTSNVQGFFPTFFAYGDVLVETASEQKESFLLSSVPNPQEISSKIMALHDEIIETEGRHRQILEGEGLLAPKMIGPKKSESKEMSAKETPMSPEKTAYQELLEKEKTSPEPSEAEKSEGQKTEGEISKDDLDKGGEIDLKNDQ